MIEIDLSEARRGAEAARDLLLALRARYDLSRWEYTDKIRIAPLERPHSHPVLTLNSRYVLQTEPDEDAFLCCYLHEQIHWGLTLYRANETTIAVERFRELYPDAHTGPPDTAADEYSTYLHLAVNWLEIEAATEFIGRPRTESVARRSMHYKWMYAAVMDDRDQVREILRSTNVLPLPSAGKMGSAGIYK